MTDTPSNDLLRRTNRLLTWGIFVLCSAVFLIVDATGGGVPDLFVLPSYFVILASFVASGIQSVRGL